MKYLCDPRVAPTVVPESAAQLRDIAERVCVFSTELHVDFADGVFAPNTTWPLHAAGDFEMPDIPSNVQLEAHLMIGDPMRFGMQLTQKGFKRIIAHREAFADASEARSVLTSWRDAGAEVGLALLLDSPLSSLEGLIDACDEVLLMSIQRIGQQGEPFDEHALMRVEELHAKYPTLIVGVDGGVTEATVEQLVRAGANRLSVGAAISRSDDPAQAYARIYERAMRGCKPVTLEMNV